MDNARRTVFRALAKHVANPVMRRGVRLGIAPDTTALLETTGRHSGKPRQTPVLNGLDDDTFWLIAEHGRDADYVRNLLADSRVRVKAGGSWRTGTAAVALFDDSLARRREIERRHGVMGRLDGWVYQAAATDPLTIRIDLDPR